MQPPGPAAGALAERMLAALLAAADKRSVTALVGANEPPLGVVVLPDLAAGVVIVDRGDETPEALKGRLEAILRGHANGVLHLVLAGGGPADRAILAEADRGAPDPNRLGVHLLDETGRLTRVAGRRLGLLAEAARLLGKVSPLTEAQLVVHNTRTKSARQEAATFAATLDHRPQWAIRILGAVCILMFALAKLWGHRSFAMANFHMGANSTPFVRAGEVWRLLAYAFLHANETHLIVNLIGLFSFGGFLEGLLGWRRIVILYGLSALLGGIAAVFIGQVDLSVGASGALWGLMTAGIGIVLRREAILPPLISGRLRPRLLSVLALNVAFSLAPLFVAGFPRIDLWAHAGGGVAGFALAASGWLTRGLTPGAPPSAAALNPRWLRVAAIAVLAVMAAAVALALINGQPWQPQVVPEPDQLT